VLIPSVADASLESHLRARLGCTGDPKKPLGEQQQLALRVGLIQNTPTPHLSTPDLVIFAADHGLAVDNIAGKQTQTTAATVRALLTDQVPLAGLAQLHGLRLIVVDSGISEQLEPHERLHARKIAYGTRNSRFSMAMSIEQVHAAIRAGIETAECLSGNVVGCAGVGVGSAQSAALVLSCLSEVPLRELVETGAPMAKNLLNHNIHVLESVRQRHLDLRDPVEVLAAMGGFEVAMMSGLMLAASARRFVILPDGLAAHAALMVASAIEPAVVEYCVHPRSNRPLALDRALSLFNTGEASEGSLHAVDGTGVAMTWSLVSKAAGLLARAA